MSKAAVLVVDDEPVIVESVARDLEYAHYSVGKAGTGDEALRLMRESSYDLVITDLVMPGTGGLDVLQSCKAASPDTGVFILTGYGDMASAIEALRLGADDYLTKPCNPDELLIRIERYLEKQKAVRTIRQYEDILSVCVYCKKIKNNTTIAAGSGKWVSVEEFILEKSGSLVSHSCCPECLAQHRKDI